jgi:hypothetical protein
VSGNGGGNLDMSSSNFSQTLIGEAVSSAVTELASKLDADAGKMPKQNTVQMNGVVADASDPASIVINVGTRSGVHPGDRLLVTRVSRVIKDPVRGTPFAVY